MKNNEFAIDTVMWQSLGSAFSGEPMNSLLYNDSSDIPRPTLSHAAIAW